MNEVALDMFLEEPAYQNHRLFECPNFILILHSAGLAEEAAARMGIASVQNILDYFAGTRDAGLVVNKASLSDTATKMLIYA